MYVREINPYWDADAQDPKIDNLVKYLQDGKPVRAIEWTVSRRRDDNDKKRKTEDKNVGMRRDGKRKKIEGEGHGRGRENTPTSDIVEGNGQTHDGRALYQESNPSQFLGVVLGKILDINVELKKSHDQHNKRNEELVQQMMQQQDRNRYETLQILLRLDERDVRAPEKMEQMIQVCLTNTANITKVYQLLVKRSNDTPE